MAFQWYWKSDLRLGDDHDAAWTKYAPKQSAELEKAFSSGTTTLALSKSYTVDFPDMIQFRTGDRYRQRAIKRVKVAETAADGPVSWLWKQDLRKKDERPEAWRSFTAAVAAKVESAYQSGAKTVKVGGVHVIDFKQMVQHRASDKAHQRPVKRVTGAEASAAPTGAKRKAIPAADSSSPTKKRAASPPASPAKAAKRSAPKPKAATKEHDEEEEKTSMKRKAWVPLTDKKKDVPGSGSKFGGVPVMKKGEGWPSCGTCDGDMTFVLQLNFSELPPEIQATLGKSGVFQCFLCMGDDGTGGCFSTPTTALLRVWDPATEAADPSPAVPSVFKFKPNVIRGWKCFDDHPHDEDADHSEEDDDKEGEVYDNDKLGGWPDWVQFPEWATCPTCKSQMVLLFQLRDRALEYEWGDAGNAHIQMCPNAACHRAAPSVPFAFDFACC